MSSLSRRPILLPIFAFGTVAILSTMSRQRICSPLPSFGSSGSRNKGASAGSVVIAQIVIDPVASNRRRRQPTFNRG
jgi:hypothetical protein